MKAALYLRQSDPSKKALEGKEQTLSLETQEAQCREFAGKHGWTVVAVYQEQISSEVFEGRPELTRMISSNGYDVIVVWSFDRISRDPLQSIVFSRMMKSRGIEVWSVAEGKTENSEVGEMVTFIIGTMGKMQKKSILTKCQDTKKKMIDDGLLVGTGIAKYGYRYEQHKRAINEEEAEVIRKIFALGADGKSLSEIALALNVENIPGPKTTWHVQAVYRVLTDASYYGAPSCATKRLAQTP